jgi:GNAT superfamily N-acetyltransferase
MTVLVRLAGPADLAAAVRVDPKGSEPERHAWLDAAFRGEHGRACRIAELDGEAVGFAVVGAFFSYPFLELIVTAEAARRKGVASALMGHWEATGGGRKLFVSTNRSNTVMQAVLAARGYVFAGEVDHLDEGDPELFFVRLPAKPAP